MPKLFGLLIILAFIACASATCGGNDTLSIITNLPGCMIDSLLSTVSSGLSQTVNQLIPSTLSLIGASPSLSWFCGPYNNVMAVIESLYSLAFMGTGLYFILASVDVDGRLKAKDWMKNLFLMVLFLSVSFPLFQLMLSLNSSITSSFITQSTKGLFVLPAMAGSAIFAIVILSSGIFLLMLTFGTLLGRYLLIPFLFLFFPVSIFLYFVPFTKEWGETFLRLIISVVFMSSIDALFILALAALLQSPDPTLADSFIRTMAILLGLSLIGVLNLVIAILAILSVIGAATSSLGPVKYLIAGAVGSVIL